MRETELYITYYIKQGLAQNHAEGGDSIYSPMRCERAWNADYIYQRMALWTTHRVDVAAINIYQEWVQLYQEWMKLYQGDNIYYIRKCWCHHESVMNLHAENMSHLWPKYDWIIVLNHSWYGEEGKWIFSIASDVVMMQIWCICHLSNLGLFGHK